MPRAQSAEAQYVSNRVSMPTAKSSAEISRDIPTQIRARAFFSARVAEAHILDQLRQVSDDYSAGKLGREEAVTRLRDFLGARRDASGNAVYDLDQTGLKNLASHSRLNLILRQNERMAKAAGEYERMYDPDIKDVFPYVIYHAEKNARASHAELEGKIFDKDDPFLLAHWPPWDFNCNCYLEDCTARRAGKTPELIQPVTPAGQVTVNRTSGFSFDPRDGFDTTDLSSLQPVSRRMIVEEAAEAVKDQRLGSCGLIAAPATTGNPPIPLAHLKEVERGLAAMEAAARQELTSVGLDPDNLPDYEQTNAAFRAAQRQGENIPGSVLDHFPKTPIEVDVLNHRAADAAGLPDGVPVMLGRGNTHHGVEHLWRDHKELFVDPQTAIRLLRETLGNPNCRVVVSLKPAAVKSHIAGKNVKTPICLRRIVLHNPRTQAYCVMVYDGKELKLVSWNNAGDDYGKEEWTLE